jgi:tetratricopeptide (TPR) repeat protein
MPAFEYSYLSLAFAQIGQEQIEQASDSYKKLDGISPLGASMAAAGLADLDIYVGRFNDAIKILDQAAKNDLAAKSTDSAADKFAALAYIQLMKGQRAQAVAMAQKALTCSKARKIRFLAARTFVEGGELDKAQTLATELGSEILAEPQAYGKIIEGQILLKKGNKAEAIKRLAEANNILNTWIGHFDLGRAYVEAGAFAEATSEFDQCITRRGEVLALFLDEVPTFGYLPAVYYYQGRADEGLDAKAATKAYTKFISIQGKGEGGEFLQDANKRLAKLGGK